jgi:hypothetical protein
MTDCSDVAEGVQILAILMFCFGFVLGWRIKKALMLESWHKKTDEFKEL